MGLTFFVATAGLVVAGYFGYRKLQNIEDEIRSELESRDEHQKSEAGKAAELKPSEKPAAPSQAEEVPDEQPEALMLERVRQSPGILQTEIYDAFASRGRKELQEMLLKMDREGRVRREKKGNTYRLFPL